MVFVHPFTELAVAKECQPTAGIHERSEQSSCWHRRVIAERFPPQACLLRTLVHNGSLSAKQLGEALDVTGNNLHYHLDTLVDVGLVDHRKKDSPDSDGLFSYYRATPMGDIVLEEGIEALMRREAELLESYR